MSTQTITVFPRWDDLDAIFCECSSQCIHIPCPPEDIQQLSLQQVSSLRAIRSRIYRDDDVRLAYSTSVFGRRADHCNN